MDEVIAGNLCLNVIRVYSNRDMEQLIRLNKVLVEIRLFCDWVLEIRRKVRTKVLRVV